VLTHIWHWKQHHYDSLAAWLGRHAASAGLQQLALDCADWRHNSFSPPWHQQQSLRVLNIASCELPASSMRELSHLTALTELSFCDVVTSSSSSSSGSSQVLTRSQAKEQQQKQVVLAATRPPARAAGPATVAATASELGCTLPRLHALVSLTLGGHTVSALLPALTAPAPAAGVNVLQQQLASLKLLETACITPELLAALPGTLTRLELQAVGPGLSQFPQGGWDITKNVLISQASTPQLGQLTQLQQLHLKGIGVTGRQPGSLTALFCGLTQLTAFSINGHSAVARGRLPATGSPELGEFMSAMGCLTNLRSLQMTGGFRCVHWELDSDDEELWWEEEEEEPPTDYAPLTAGVQG
jgi:hypothetical protein